MHCDEIFFPVVGVLLSCETFLSSILPNVRPYRVCHLSLESIQADLGSGWKEAMSQGQSATENEIGCERPEG